MHSNHSKIILIPIKNHVKNCFQQTAAFQDDEFNGNPNGNLKKSCMALEIKTYIQPPKFPLHELSFEEIVVNRIKIVYSLMDSVSKSSNEFASKSSQEYFLDLIVGVSSVQDQHFYVTIDFDHQLMLM